MSPEEFIIWLDNKLRVSDNSENTIIEVRKKLSEVNAVMAKYWSNQSDKIIHTC